MNMLLILNVYSLDLAKRHEFGIICNKEKKRERKKERGKERYGILHDLIQVCGIVRKREHLSRGGERKFKGKNSRLVKETGSSFLGSEKKRGGKPFLRTSSKRLSLLCQYIGETRQKEGKKGQGRVGVCLHPWPKKIKVTLTHRTGQWGKPVKKEDSWTGMLLSSETRWYSS